MSKYKELVYLVLDEIKAISDDSTFNEDHIIYLLNKYRAVLLKQRYTDVRKEIPNSNYQTIDVDLHQSPAIDGCDCTNGFYLSSVNKIPSLLPIGSIKVYPVDCFQGDNITYISKERMRFVGYNKYLKNIIYCALNLDNYLIFKSNNPQHKYLEKVRITGIFEHPEDVFELTKKDKGLCDILDSDFPIEDALITPLLELVVKDLLGASYRPKDDTNNANDDLSDLANFIFRNIKNKLQKQMSGDE